MAKQKLAANKRKKQGGKRPVVALLITILLIVLAFYLLEMVQKGVEKRPVAKPPVTERYKLPPRGEERAAEIRPHGCRLGFRKLRSNQRAPGIE